MELLFSSWFLLGGGGDEKEFNAVIFNKKLYSSVES